jgi:DNA-directed RNA polymerase specialized sigma subunit
MTDQKFKYTHTKREKNPDTPEFVGKYYLTNAKLYPAVVRAKAEGKITEELGKMLLTLTTNYAKNRLFSGYTYKDDMIGGALVNLSQNALKFDSDKYTNAFSYFTTCIHRSFLQFLNSEKKHRRIRDQLLIEIGENPSFNYSDEYQSGATEENGLKESFEELSDQISEAKVREAAEKIRDAEKAKQREIDAEALLAVENLIDDEESTTEDISDDTVFLLDDIVDDSLSDDQSEIKIPE